MAYEITYDEQNPNGLIDTTAGTFDAPDSVYEWLISPYYVIAEKDSYNDIAYGFSDDTNLPTDVDVYSLGQLSTGVYKAEVDSYPWDYTNMTFG